MKVTGTQRIGSRAPAGRKKAAGGTGTCFSDSLNLQGAENAAPMKGASPVAAVDGILALQEVPDAADGRSKGIAHGRDLLDALEDIRRGLLIGAIPIPRLKRIAGMVRQRREMGCDPQLSAILDDIELRAAVELAKLGVYL